jgi:hypothetical protein
MASSLVSALGLIRLLRRGCRPAVYRGWVVDIDTGGEEFDEQTEGFE